VRTVRRPAGRTVAAKVTAGIGAAFLIAAVAMASLLEPLQSLGQLLTRLDQPLLESMDRMQRSGMSLWIWSHLAVPVLTRPAWMLPTMFGVVLVGAAAQLAWGNRR
jgi:hypothetical protein